MARAHGAGTLIKRGKFYCARWMVKGKLYTRSTKCTNEREAQKKLEEFTKPFRENSEIEVVENLAAKVRVIENDIKKSKDKKTPPLKTKFLVDAYKKDINSSPIQAGTEANYETMVNRLYKFTKREYVYEITKEDIEKFLKHVKTVNGAPRYNSIVLTMRKLFDVVKKQDFRIRTNPWREFKTMKLDKSQRRRELHDDEVKKLIECAYADDEELGMMFEISAYTGLRKSDCQLLKWENVNLKKKLIVILPAKTAKTGVEAHIPIHPKLMKMFSKLDKEKSKYVLPKMAAIGRAWLNKHLRKVFKKAGVEVFERDANGKVKMKTGFHALRHYFISQCVKSGIPVSVVQRMVAHSSADMSLHYTHTFDSDLQLPDYDNENMNVKLKKTTVELLDKARGKYERDEFILKLLTSPSEEIKKVSKMSRSDIELEQELDKMFDK